MSKPKRMFVLLEVDAPWPLTTKQVKNSVQAALVNATNLGILQVQVNVAKPPTKEPA